MNKHAGLAPILIALGAWLAAPGPADAQAPPARPEESPPPAQESAAPAPAPETPARALAGWRRLRFGATKFLVGSARSTIERWPAGDGGPEGLVRVTTSMGYFGHEARLHHAYSVQPARGGLPARWMELDPGKRARETTVVPDGQLTLRRFGPPPGQDEGWSGAWVEGRTDHAAAKTVPAGGPCGSPLDPWGLLARLGCLTKGDEVRFVLLSNDGGHEVIARRGESRQTRVSLVNLDDGSRSTVTLDQWRVDLLPAPGEPDPSFFGLDGGITLWIDAASGAPVEISGRRSGVGTIRFRLNGVSLTPRPRPAIPWPSTAESALAAPQP